MNTSRISDEFKPRGTANPLTLRAVLIYEDLNTGLRAFHAFERVVEALKLEIDFQATLWRADILSELARLGEASDQAGDADFVFLCAHGRLDLQDGVTDWLEHWIERKSDEPRALAISLDEPGSDRGWADHVLASLEARARAGNVVVFPHFDDPSRRNAKPVGNSIRRQIHANLNDLQRWSEFRPRWGINE